MATRNITLTEHDEQLIHRLLTSGRYGNVGEVLRAGLRLLEQEAKEDEQKLIVLRSLAAEAFASLDRGEGVTIEGEQKLENFVAEIGRRVAAHPTAIHNSD